MSGLSFLVLECANLSASRHFYEALLSVRFAVESHGAGPEHLSAALEGGLVLELYPGSSGSRGVRLGLSIRNVPAARERLRASGPLRDPDGRRVILVERARFAYVGPEHVRERVADMPAGARIDSAAALRDWLSGGAHEATFTVGADGWLALAPLRSEHVACAAGGPVLAAGMIAFEAGEVSEVSNQSTGFCPPPDCWPALAAALDRAAIAHPGGWTTALDFRRCDQCGAINIVKDGWLACACGHPLAARWNF